jgi:signal transduction histidine kinase
VNGHLKRTPDTHLLQRGPVHGFTSTSDMSRIHVTHRPGRLPGGNGRLIRERDARTRLAVLEERAQVARELHDSVAHAVSVMVLQAGAAEQIMDTAPADARTAI